MRTVLFALASFILPVEATGAQAAASSYDGVSWEAAYRRGIAARLAGRHQEAREVLEPLLASPFPASGDPRRVMAAEALASAYAGLGDSATAERLYRAVLEMGDGDPTARGPAVALALNNLAQIRAERGNWDEAISLLERALVICRSLHGDNSPITATGWGNLGSLYIMQGRFSEAASVLERALQVFSPGSDQTERWRLAALGNLAKAYAQMGQYSRAMPLFEEALALGARQGGADPTYADVLVGMSTLLRGLNKLDESEPLLRKAVSIYERTGRMNKLAGAGVLSGYGFLRRRQLRHEEAEMYFRRTLEVARKSVGPEHPAAAVAEMNLAGTCLKTGKRAESDELMRHSYGIIHRSYGVSKPLARWLLTRAELDADLHRYKDASARYQEAIEVLERAVGAEHPAMGEAIGAYADFLKVTRKKEWQSVRRRADMILALPK